MYGQLLILVKIMLLSLLVIQWTIDTHESPFNFDPLTTCLVSTMHAITPKRLLDFPQSRSPPISLPVDRSYPCSPMDTLPSPVLSRTHPSPVPSRDRSGVFVDLGLYHLGARPKVLLQDAGQDDASVDQLVAHEPKREDVGLDVRKASYKRKLRQELQGWLIWLQGVLRMERNQKEGPPGWSI